MGARPALERWVEQCVLHHTTLTDAARACCCDLQAVVPRAEFEAATEHVARGPGSGTSARLSFVTAKASAVLTAARSTRDPEEFARTADLARRLSWTDERLSGWARRALLSLAEASSSGRADPQSERMFPLRAWHEKEALRLLFMHMVFRANVPPDRAKKIVMAVRKGSVRRPDGGEARASRRQSSSRWTT